MAVKGMVAVPTHPDPEVVTTRCCGGFRGVLARVNGAWCSIRVWFTESDGKMHDAVDRTAICRNCYRRLDRNDNEVTPWVWGEDPQIDEALRRAAREFVSGKKP